jgi:hypothetical protein
MAHVSKLGPISCQVDSTLRCLVGSQVARNALLPGREKFVGSKIFVGLPSASAIITAIY